MKTLIAFGAASALALGALAGTATAQPNGNGGKAVGKNLSGPGKVRVGVDASVWSSNFPEEGCGPARTCDRPEEGLYPIGGNGQVNGEFVTAERNGIEVGIRAQERFEGTYPAQAGKGNRSGVYEVPTGTSDGAGSAVWNYDWHVDLRGAKGVAKGKTLGDYMLELETDISDGGPLFGLPVPLDLTFGGLVPGDTVLYQSSQNPRFGNLGFDADAGGDYHFRVVLTPETFNGPPLAAAVTVEVADPTP